MAYFNMPKIGEPVTCDSPCEHGDCQATRKIASTPCEICGEIIEAGRAYILTEKGAPLHYSCRIEQIEEKNSNRPWGKRRIKHMAENGHTPKESLKLLYQVLEDAEACTDGLSCVSCTGELGSDENGNDTEVEHEEGCRWLALQEVLPVIDLACNVHAEMLKILKEVAQAHQPLPRKGQVRNERDDYVLASSVMNRVHAVIAKVKGPKGRKTHDLHNNL